MPGSSEKEFVRRRAEGRCEYCRAPEEITGYTFHIEHIEPRSKGGPDGVDNYALSCVSCNGPKSNHTHGQDPKTGKVLPLFNPRKQRWSEHFRITHQLFIMGKTPIGRATVNRLSMNSDIQVSARRYWAALGVYP